MPTTVHPLSNSLPDPWDTAIGGWVVWLIAAGSSSATRRTRAHVRAAARQLGAAHPRDVTADDLLGLLGRSISTEHRRGLRAVKVQHGLF